MLRRSFARNVDNKESKVSLQLCAAVGESLGLKSQILDLPTGLVNRIETPALIVLKGNELAVLLEIKKDKLLLARPRHALEAYRISDFADLLENQSKLPVLVLQTTERTPKKDSDLNGFYQQYIRIKNLFLKSYLHLFLYNFSS